MFTQMLLHRVFTRSRAIRLALLAMTLLLGACNFAALGATETPVPSDTPLPPTETFTPVSPTNTPVPPTDTSIPPSDTPEPTQTPTETFTPTPDLAATAAFESTQAAEAQLETIYADLEAVNLFPESGFLAWSSADDVDLGLYSYNTYDYWPIDDGKDFDDFVLRADITWESTGGWAICGFVIRGGPNLSQDRYYIFQTIRLSGLPSWDVELWEFGRWIATTSGTIRAAPVIDQANGATNEFTLVVNGSTMNIYGNQTRLGTVTLTSKSEGTVGFYAWQETGETTCSYSNAWVWALEE